MQQSFVATHKPGKCAVSAWSYHRPVARKSKPHRSQATQATTRENLSSGFPRKQVSNQSLQLNRLDMKIIFFSHKASLGIILLKKQTTKLLIILRGCAGWSGPLLLQITEDRFSQSRSYCYMCHLTMTHIRKQDAKFDYREI